MVTLSTGDHPKNVFPFGNQTEIALGGNGGTALKNAGLPC